MSDVPTDCAPTTRTRDPGRRRIKEVSILSLLAPEIVVELAFSGVV